MLSIIILFYIAYILYYGPLLPPLINTLFNKIWVRLLVVVIVLLLLRMDEPSAAILLAFAYILTMKDIRDRETFYYKKKPSHGLPIPKGYGYNQIPSNLLRNAMHISNDKITKLEATFGAV